MPRLRLSRARLVVALVVVALSTLAWKWRDEIGNWNDVRNGRRPLLDVVTWHYQLDRIQESLPQLAANTADMLVIDHAKSGGKVALTPAEVEGLKVRPDGTRRFVISYMSIGEAEEFRFYWNPKWKQSPPAWLGEENCAWPQAHRVRFWIDDWKDISFRGPQAFLKRIVDAGFDGVYLDRVDIYEGFVDKRPTARREMIEFVAALAETARRLKPGFIVIAQNAEDLLSERDYRRAIDGIAKESLLHGASATGQRNKPEDIAWSRERLAKLAYDRKPVFVVEYLVKYTEILKVRRELNAMGYVPTFPTRSLDGDEPTLPRDIKTEIGTPERTLSACPAGSSW